jgi:sporulation protein YunB
MKEKDQNGKIQSITLDSRSANLAQVETTEYVRTSLYKLSTEKITVPLGVALGSNILASLGPSIPITLVPVGATNVEIVPELREKGINMVLFTVNLKITTKLKIVIPFSTNEAVVDHNVMIGQELIVGDVPVYFFNGNQLYPMPIGPTLPNETENHQ